MKITLRTTRGSFPLEIVAWVASSLAGAFAAGIAGQDPITELAADRTAVERVYYDHRLGTKPPFEQVLPAVEVARLVNADLHKEALLAQVYHVEVTSPQVEADVKRIDLETRAPEMLAWAWGMNGALSVVGATLAIFIAMNWGFRITLVAASCTYLLAGAALGVAAQPQTYQ